MLQGGRNLHVNTVTTEQPRRDEQHSQLSRALSRALRHEPEQFGITLDAQGWADLKQLLSALGELNADWNALNFDNLLATNKKRRFDVEGGRIRALYGHSTKPKILMQACEPPVSLFHGTDPRSAQFIAREGLKPMGRNYVHLASEKKYATRARHRKSCQPILFEVRSADAFRSGISFYQSNDVVWLSESIPVEFLKVLTTSFQATV